MWWGDSVNVEAKTLELTGAVVANASIERDAYGKVDKMTDQGNLTIEVADVTVSDVSNRDEHESSYVGVDVSGFSGAVQVPQGGSMGIRVSTGGHHKAGVTAATLGEGSLSAERVTVVTSDKSKTGVNRDLSSRQVTHVDETTGGLDVNIRVDNRLLTDTTDYVVEGAKNTVGLVGNTAQAVANGSRVAANLGAAVVDNVTGNGHDGVAADFQGRLRNQELGLQSKINDDLVLALNQLSEDPKAAEAALTALANQAVHANGIEGDVAVAFYHAKDGAMGGHKDGKIFINLAYQDGQMATLLTVMGDELSHYVDAKVGRPTSLDDPRRQDISTFYGDNAGEQAKGALGTERVGAEAFQNGLKGLDFQAVNDVVANTEGMEKRTVEDMIRDVYYKDTGRDADADWVQVPELMDEVMDPFDIGLEGTVGVLTVGAGTDGGSIGLSSPGFNVGGYFSFIPGGSTASDKEISGGLGPIDLKIIQSGNGNYGVGFKFSVTTPWPRYSAEFSWDVANAETIDNKK